MTERRQLWSEATAVIEFGEGTKIRLGNASVRLKGTYFREDSFIIQQLKRDVAGAQKTISDAHEALTVAYEEKYPYDAAESLTQRIKNCAKKLIHERSEKQKLIVMCSDRDAEIARLKNANRVLKDAIVALSAASHTEMLKAVISHA